MSSHVAGSPLTRKKRYCALSSLVHQIVRRMVLFTNIPRRLGSQTDCIVAAYRFLSVGKKTCFSSWASPSALINFGGISVDG